jgi:hypothetical protein
MKGLDAIDDAYFYHYDRANAELDYAEHSDGRAAEIHRQLAALHLARKQQLGFLERLARRELSTAPFRADKEA